MTTVKPFCRGCEENEMKESGFVCFLLVLVVVFFFFLSGGSSPDLGVASKKQNCSKVTCRMGKEMTFIGTGSKMAVERAHLRRLVQQS